MSVFSNRRKVLKPIYGLPSTANNQIDCNRACECNLDMFNLMTKMSILVNRTQTVIMNLFPSISVKATLIADMKMNVRMNINTYIWLAVSQYFAKNYPDVAFDVHNRDHLAILMDSYLEHGFPWEDDPILRAYPLVR